MYDHNYMYYCFLASSKTVLLFLYQLLLVPPLTSDIIGPSIKDAQYMSKSSTHEIFLEK